MGTTTDLTASILGLFYKPFEEYQDYQVSHRERPLSSTSSQAAKRPISSSSTGNRALQTTNEEADYRLNPTNSIFSTANASSVSERPPSRHGAGLAGRMAGASMKSLANFVPTALKGMTVDIPLAMTEGMRNVPRLYGEKPLGHGRVTDIKSGFALAGKGFALGMTEAVSDLVVKPYEGMREDGAKGAVKGIGKGMANMTSKAGCAMFGVMVYPSVGIAKSLKSAIFSRTKKRIVEARRAEGAWLLDHDRLAEISSDVTSFPRVLKGKKT